MSSLRCHGCGHVFEQYERIHLIHRDYWDENMRLRAPRLGEPGYGIEGDEMLCDSCSVTIKETK